MYVQPVNMATILEHRNLGYQTFHLAWRWLNVRADSYTVKFAHSSANDYPEFVT
jgi:hypothetical protein